MIDSRNLVGFSREYIVSSVVFIVLEGEYLSTHNRIHHIEVRRKSDGLASDLFVSEVKV